MSNIGDALRRAPSTSTRRSVTVSIAGEEFTLYSHPLRGSDIDWVTRHHKGFAANPTIKATVDLIVRKCENEDGTKAFDATDKQHLALLPVNVIHTIQGTLFESDTDLSEEAIEDEAKNS